MRLKNQKSGIKKSPRGLSLPYVIGALTLLMFGAMSINGLVIRAMKSVRGIEGSNRAWFAAEAGIEDALYELSPHYAGYETPSLTDPDDEIRKTPFNSLKTWKNRWTIRSRAGKNVTKWTDQFDVKDKLIVFLYRDDNFVRSAADEESKINDEPRNIVTLKQLSTNFRITFSIPPAIAKRITDETTNNAKLTINNDQDNNFNEDDSTKDSKTTPPCQTSIKDADCDGKIDEDGDNNPVIIWKLTDGGSRSLIPLKGCLKDSFSEICEKDFNNIQEFPSGKTFSASLTQSTKGLNQDGEEEAIGKFIQDSAVDAELRFEFLVLPPLEHTILITKPTIKIPTLDYEVESTLETDLPLSYFTLQSDGYYGQYKQSIDTKVSPKTTVPLFDFTIIQQK